MSSFVKITFCSLFSVQLKGTFGSRARVTKSRSPKSRSTLIQIIVTVCDTVSYNNTKCMHNICTCRYHIVFIYVYIYISTYTWYYDTIGLAMPVGFSLIRLPSNICCGRLQLLLRWWAWQETRWMAHSTHSKDLLSWWRNAPWKIVNHHLQV